MTYWSQFERSELIALQQADFHDYKDDSAICQSDDMYVEDLDLEKTEDDDVCDISMDSLGLSWRDFL